MSDAGSSLSAAPVGSEMHAPHGAKKIAALAAWEVLEDELRERFDSVLSALQRTERGAR